jgi:enoyl-CoA hydratase
VSSSPDPTPPVPVRVEREGPLAVLIVEHPPLNLVDRAVLDGLAAALEEIESALPRALLVRAEGRVVSAGVDVHLFEGVSPGEAHRLWTELLGTIARLEALPLPTVFAAHALTLTALFEVALACDLLLAARSARFGLVERVIGLTPAMGGTQRLVERAGPARARELVMTGELFDAETLERWGVVNRVLDDQDFTAQAHAFATTLAEGPTLAHATTKRIVRATLDGGVAAADRLVPPAAGALFATEDLQAGVASFLTDGPGRATFNGR